MTASRFLFLASAIVLLVAFLCLLPSPVSSAPTPAAGHSMDLLSTVPEAAAPVDPKKAAIKGGADGGDQVGGDKPGAPLMASEGHMRHRRHREDDYSDYAVEGHRDDDEGDYYGDYEVEGEGHRRHRRHHRRHWRAMGVERRGREGDCDDEFGVDPIHGEEWEGGRYYDDGRWGGEGDYRGDYRGGRGGGRYGGHGGHGGRYGGVHGHGGREGGHGGHGGGHGGHGGGRGGHGGGHGK